MPADVRPTGGGATFGRAGALVVTVALGVAAQAVVGTACWTKAGFSGADVGLWDAALGACGQTSSLPATLSTSYPSFKTHLKTTLFHSVHAYLASPPPI